MGKRQYNNFTMDVDISTSKEHGRYFIRVAFGAPIRVKLVMALEDAETLAEKLTEAVRFAEESARSQEPQP